jgi:transglutaminase-like putative cysteine protease
MTIYSVRHITTYRYKKPVAFGEHRMMLSPREDPDQRLLDLNLEIDPKPSALRWSRDVFGNRIAIAHFATQAATLLFQSTMRIAHALTDIVDAEIEDFARHCPFAYGAEDMAHLVQFIERSGPDRDDKVRQWAQSMMCSAAATGTRAALVHLTRSIHETFKYVARHEKGIQDPLATLSMRTGSCRDMAFFMIDALRSLGLAARFVSGYLHVRSCAGGHARGGNTHAWVQAYVPGCGWIDFDPSSGIVGNRGLVRVAVVRDPRHAIPLRGVWIGRPGDSLDMKVEVKVSAAEESPSLGLMPPSTRPLPA